MTLNFSASLTAQNITSISKRFGFIDNTVVEKFIMDFEMHHHITNQLNCITRGGMCMPFHTEDNDAKRLSKDIDLCTSESILKVKQIMEKIDNTIPEIQCEEIIAKDPYPLDNLISYKIHYTSCFGSIASIKVDFFCDVDVSLNHKIIPSGYSIFGFNTDKDISILSKGALMGDKLTTLALDTIGLKSSKWTEIAKQIYDVGVLVKSFNTSDLKSSFQTFIDLTTVKINHFDNTPKYEISNIIENISNSLNGFLELTNAISITKVQQQRYNGFKGTYLSKNSNYKKTEHVTDVLLIKLYVQFLQMLNSDVTIDDASDKFSKILDELNKIKAFDVDASVKSRSLYIQQILDKKDFKKKLLEHANLEHVFLLKELFSNQ